MQWHQNKIQVSSVIYICFLAVILIAIGSWHNLSLTNNFQGSIWTIYMLLIISIVLTSALYLLIIVISKSGNDEAITPIKKEMQEMSELEIISTVKNPDSFDVKSFISGIIPEEKSTRSEFCELVLKNLAGKLNGVQGIFYIRSSSDLMYKPAASYAYFSNQNPPEFKMGETLSGQAVKDQRILIIQNIPDQYITVLSGLGNGNPKCILMLPVCYKSEVIGLIELATFKSIDSVYESALKDISDIIGEKIIKLTK